MLLWDKRTNEKGGVEHDQCTQRRVHIGAKYKKL